MMRDELMDYTKRKKAAGRLLAIFVSAMALLTFFSNTINNFLLPGVAADNPSRGALIKEISGEGIIEAKNVYEEYTDTNLKVLEVMVGEGDSVKKGQPILRLDIEELENELKEEEIKYRQLQLALERLKDGSTLRSYDRAIEKAKENLEKNSEDYTRTKILYGSGAVPESELKDSERGMKIAEKEYDIALQDREDRKNENIRDIENAELDLQLQEVRLNSLRGSIANGGLYTALGDGIITELSFSEGTMANSTKPLFRLAETSGGFQLSISVDSEQADYVEQGDKANVTITSGGDTRVEGRMARVKEDLQDGGRKELLIDVGGEGLTGGESCYAVISKRTQQYEGLVPNSAVYTDSEGTYVYVVRKSDGPLGAESYVQRTPVTVLDSDSTKTAVIGVMPMDEVVTGSTKPLSDGGRVVVEQYNE